jgi:hypothetical protein
MIRLARRKKSCSKLDDDEWFCDVFTVEQPHNTGGTSIHVSIAEAAVETTIVFDQNSVQK